MAAGDNQTCLGHAFQMAQTTRALQWIVMTLKDSGFGSEAGVPTLGECECVATLTAGLRQPGYIWIWDRSGGGAAAGPLSPAKPAPRGAEPVHHTSSQAQPVLRT